MEHALFLSGDELSVHIGNRKRDLILPQALVSLDVLGARYTEDTLAVTFGSKEVALQGIV